MRDLRQGRQVEGASNRVDRWRGLQTVVDRWRGLQTVVDRWRGLQTGVGRWSGRSVLQVGDFFPPPPAVTMINQVNKQS